MIYVIHGNKITFIFIVIVIVNIEFSSDENINTAGWCQTIFKSSNE